jgi:hypothetical protein
MNKHYTITAYLVWRGTQTFTVNTDVERDVLVTYLKEQAYTVTWQSIKP